MMAYTEAAKEIMSVLLSKGFARQFARGGRPTIGDANYALRLWNKSTVAPIGGIVLREEPQKRSELGWCREKRTRLGEPQFLFESIDCSTSYWLPIKRGMWYLPKEVCDQHPEWQWTNDQFTLMFRWKKVFKEHHTLYASNPVFGDEQGVTLEVADSPDVVVSKYFPNWKEIKRGDMLAMLRELMEIRHPEGER